MSDPVRLKDDPAFEDLARALADEQAIAGALPTAALKGRVLAGLASSGALATGGAATAAFGKGALLLSGLTGLALGLAGTLAVERALDDGGSVTPPPPPVVEAPVAEMPVAEMPVVETPVANTPVVETPVVETPVEPAVRRRAAREDPAKAAPARGERGLGESSLADEMRRYERAEVALRERRFEVAIDELQAYLRAYPRGTLRAEVRLSLLEATLGARRYREARSLARELAKDPALAARREEIRRAEAVALEPLREHDGGVGQ